MIDYNKEHIHVSHIVDYINLSDKRIKNNYRVYGLKNTDKGEILNPLILLEHRPGAIEQEKLNNLTAFFKNNDIHFHAQEINNDKDIIYIGLRRDFREHKDLCSSALKTIIYFLENKVEIPSDMKLHKIPPFRMTLEIKEDKNV